METGEETGKKERMETGEETGKKERMETGVETKGKNKTHDFPSFDLTFTDQADPSSCPTF